MASTDARPVPRKNVAFRFYFAIRKPSDSTLITTWAGADSEVSLDGASYSDCTNEATEIGTTGTGYIDLTSSEMNADAVLLKVTVTNTGAVPLVFTLFPEEAGDYRGAVTSIGTDLIDAASIKADAVTEIQLGLMTSAGYTAPNNSGIADIKAKTDQMAFTLTGRVDATVDTDAIADAVVSGIGDVGVSSFTAGALEQLTTLTRIVVESPHPQSGVLRLNQDDDYTTGRAIHFTNIAGTWPTLTGSIKLRLSSDNGESYDSDGGAVLVATGAGQDVSIELTSSLTGKLWGEKWSYQLIMTPVTGDVCTLEQGTAIVSKRLPAPDA